MILSVEAPLNIEFVLEAEKTGRKVTPASIPFQVFSEFNSEVVDFVLGSERPRNLNDIDVSIQEGSYLLRVLIPIGLFSTLPHDLAALRKHDSLADIDDKRARIIDRWQSRAREDQTHKIVIKTAKDDKDPIRIDSSSTFRNIERNQWVSIEQYLVGEITDWGGATAVNVHLRLRDTKKIIKIDAKPDQIRSQEKNLVLHRAIVHIRAKQCIATNEIREMELIDLRPFDPKFDQAEMDRFTTEGKGIWADVPSGATWVEQQRGNLSHD